MEPQEQIPDGKPRTSAGCGTDITGDSPHNTNEDAEAGTKQNENAHADGPLAALKKALLSVYGSPQGAFEALSNSEGIMGRKEWKKAVKKTKLSDHFSGIELKGLRSRLPKLITLSAFCGFVDGSPVQGEATEGTEASELAPLPPEVPSLPSSFRQREHCQAQLSAALLESGRRSTSLTAPKSRISSQG